MSADNWALCPKCRKESLTELENFRNEVNQSYGKVTIDDFERSRMKLEAMDERFRNPEISDHTLREDWELGTDEDGFFSVRYSCSCTKCDFSGNFKCDKQF